jgi:hypothetical protein
MLALLSYVAAPVEAGLYKCVVAGKTTYQGVSCQGGKALSAPKAPDPVVVPEQPAKSEIVAPEKPKDVQAERREIARKIRCRAAQRDLEDAVISYRLAPVPAMRMNVDTMRMSRDLDCQ